MVSPFPQQQPPLGGQLPPEFMQALMAQGGPQMPPSLGAPQLPQMPPPATDVMHPIMPPQQSSAAGTMSDPILAALLQGPMQVAPQPVLADKDRPGYRPMPDVDEIEHWSTALEHSHQRLLERMSRDLALYRQHEGGVPFDFDADNEVQVISAALSNLVNKLANLMSGADVYVEAPYRDHETEEMAQAVENYCLYCRDYKRLTYARKGGNDLQRDEFWYLFLYGRIAARVLPNTNNKRYPFTYSLLDPATVFPIWGSGDEGMRAVIRKYRASVYEVLQEYGQGNPALEKRLMKKLGYESYTADFLNHQGTIIEWWDSWNRYLSFQGVELFRGQHKLGVVPFVYVTAVGEPQALATPQGRYVNAWREINLMQPVGGDIDLAEKGVSVFHYLLNTHRLKEAVQTIWYNEVEKVRNPPTIEYIPPHMVGNEPDALDVKRGGTNYRLSGGLMEVEGIPTSPRPTDTAPLMQGLMDDWMGGSLNPAASGQEMGSNASGYSLETLIAQAKDLTVPYSKAYENFQALLFELELTMYRDVIAPLMPLAVPGGANYGSSDQMYDLTPEAIDTVGTMLKVRLKAMGPAEEARLISMAAQAVSTGFWSQKYGMDRVGVRNPRHMFAEILTEKGMQHPTVMEMKVIPEMMMEAGEPDLAKSFLDLVVMPQIMAQMGMGGAGGPPGQAPSPPDQNMGGMRQPGQPPGPPTGPQPGQGRTR